jgi:hypothetical protein
MPSLSCRGAKLFPAFVAVLKSHKSSDGTKEALLAEFKALDEHFKVNVRIEAPSMSCKSVYCCIQWKVEFRFCC